MVHEGEASSVGLLVTRPRMNRRFLRSAPPSRSSHTDDSLFVISRTRTHRCAGWLEKNRDTLTPSVVSLLRDSKVALIAELFSLSQTSTGPSHCRLRACEHVCKVMSRRETSLVLGGQRSRNGGPARVVRVCRWPGAGGVGVEAAQSPDQRAPAHPGPFAAPTPPNP